MSDSDDELYSRTCPKQKEFLAQKLEATKAIMDFMPKVEIKTRAKVEPQQESDSDSDLFLDEDFLKKKKPKVTLPMRRTLKKMVDVKRQGQKKRTRNFSSSSSDGDGVNFRATRRGAVDESSSSSGENDEPPKPPKAEESEEPTHYDSPRSGSFPEQSFQLDGSTDDRYRKAAERLAKLAERSASTYGESPEHDASLIEVEDIEENVIVRVRWPGSLLKLEIGKEQSFLTMYEYFSEIASVPVSRILLTLRDKTIKPEETPNSIKLNPIIDILVAGVIDEVNEEKEETSSTATATANPLEIELKVQCANRKNTVNVKILKNEPMSVLMSKYSDMTGKPVAKLRFKFDGEPLDKDLSAMDLDLDGGECIDVFEVV